ncbi:MAG: hypothetical protein NTY46_03800 [Candidatus Sumerlaeota bacterium]|nr:hypothetical protein [Candidatus Sumerlaeota bacterium]
MKKAIERLSGLKKFVIIGGIVWRVGAVDAAAPLQVNTWDIDLALSAGIHCMSNIMNPNDRNIPYFECLVLINTPMMRFNPTYSVQNVVGRSLYAILKAADVIGVTPDPGVVSKYRTILLDSYQLERGIPAGPHYLGGSYTDVWTFLAHCGFRGMLGMWQYQGDTTTRQYFDDGLLNLKNYFFDPGFSWQAYQQQFGLVGGGTGGSVAWPGPNVYNLESFFDSKYLVRYHAASGNQLALDMATTFGTFLLTFYFPADGNIAGYDHMYRCMLHMTDLAEIAIATSNSLMMERVRARYDNGVRAVSSPGTGWVPERLSQHSDVGEINNTGEMAETALRLAEWGWTQYYEDAERFTRAHLLPAQLLDISFVNPSPDPPPSDGYARVRERVRGAYGFPAPYGHLSTINPYLNGAFYMDIVGGGIASLAEVKTHCCKHTGEGHFVNLLFNYEDSQIKVIGPYPDDTPVYVTLKTPGDLQVRLPSWVDRAKVSVTIDGMGAPFSLTPYYLKITAPPIGKRIDVRIMLEMRYTTEVINGRSVRILWKGDSIAAMNQMGTSLPYFPEIPTNADDFQYYE